MPEASETHFPTMFAGLLRSLTGSPPRSPASWADDLLSEDVAVLSYEQALRTQSRRRPDSAGEPSPSFSAPSLTNTNQKPAADGAALAGVAPERAAPAKDALCQQDLKTASVTIRMSQAESEALHRRAIEAGLTVSAYLRYCALEVDVLRGLVKQATAEFKEAMAQERRKQAPARPNWLKRIVSGVALWRSQRPAVQA